MERDEQMKILRYKKLKAYYFNSSTSKNSSSTSYSSFKIQ